MIFGVETAANCVPLPTLTAVAVAVAAAVAVADPTPISFGNSFPLSLSKVFYFSACFHAMMTTICM